MLIDATTGAMRMRRFQVAIGPHRRVTGAASSAGAAMDVSHAAS